jgi:uncharacterized protein YndB with AHSA1/START domain
MKQLHYSVDIGAPRSKVWAVLWEDASYRDWTSVFAAGSYAISDWNQGSRIHFIDPTSNNGMSAIIEKKTPNEYMCFKHIAEIQNGKEVTYPDTAVGRERYTLTDTGGGTRLHVELDAPDEYTATFDDKFPKALQRVKELAEPTRA